MKLAITPAPWATACSARRKVTIGVGGGQHLGDAEVHLVLAGRHLVVGAVDLHPDRGGGGQHRLTEVGGRAAGDIEVAGGVVGARVRCAVGIALEEEEFDLRPDPVLVAQ